MYIHLYIHNKKRYTVLFSIFMKVEAHLGANYGKNGRFRFDKSSYPHGKSRIWLILLMDSNKIYLFMYINKMKKVILYYF